MLQLIVIDVLPPIRAEDVYVVLLAELVGDVWIVVFCSCAFDDLPWLFHHRCSVRIVDTAICASWIPRARG